MKPLKRFFRQNRYFITYYTYSDGLRNYGHGVFGRLEPGGRMFRESEVVKVAKEDLKATVSDDEYSVVIKGFNEVSKRDFYEYFNHKMTDDV